jgi:hypothetical protein
VGKGKPAGSKHMTLMRRGLVICCQGSAGLWPPCTHKARQQQPVLAHTSATHSHSRRLAPNLAVPWPCLCRYLSRFPPSSIPSLPPTNEGGVVLWKQPLAIRRHSHSIPRRIRQPQKRRPPRRLPQPRAPQQHRFDRPLQEFDRGGDSCL